MPKAKQNPAPEVVLEAPAPEPKVVDLPDVIALSLVQRGKDYAVIRLKIRGDRVLSAEVVDSHTRHAMAYNGLKIAVDSAFYFMGIPQ